MKKTTCIHLAVSLFSFIILMPPPLSRAAEYLVADDDEFDNALEMVQPGDSIVWQDGTYDDLDTLRFEPLTNGTALAPITFRAQTPGGVTFRGTTRLGIGGHHLIISGFRFDNSTYEFPDDEGSGWVIQTRAHSDITRHAYNCRVTDCAIVNYDNPLDTGNSKWVQWYGATNRFDNNFVSGKRTGGATFIVELNEGAQFDDDVVAHVIEQNVFADRPLHPDGLSANEQETLRIGTSSMSIQNARITVQSNFFYRCSGEAEIISNKSAENSYLYNTFVECVGSLTLRHGRGCLVEGNVFFGGNVPNSGGIRISNQDHTVINNYMQDLAGTTYQAAMGIMAGTIWAGPGSTSPDESGGYVQVKNCIIAQNTIIDSQESVVWGVGLGGDGRTTEPADNTFAANLIESSSAPLFTFTDTPTGTIYSSNVVWGATVGITDPGIIVADPILTTDSLGIQVPSATGPAAGNAGTEFILPDNLLDMDGALRPLLGRDVGADQIALGTAPMAPMAITDVGPTWIQSTAPPVVTQNPANQNVATLTTLILSANGTGADPMIYQWRYNGVNLVEGGEVSGADDRILSIANVQLSDAGNYDVILNNAYGSATSSVAVVTTFVQTYPPTITTQPTNDTVLTGANATFTVDASGTAPISYQWYFDTSTLLSEETNSSLTLISVDAADEGTYHAVATNPYGTDTSAAATLTVIPPDQPAEITVDPLDNTITEGQTASFFVTVIGTPPISYQWYYNTNTVLLGETNSTLSIPSAQISDAGMYSVTVTNNWGGDVSTYALLTVNEAGPAGSYQYDASNGSAGIQDGGTDWTSTGANWLLNGTGPNVTWDDNGPNDAIFGGGISGSAGYVDIPAGETRTVRNISFIQPNDGEYTIDSGNNLTSVLNLSGTPTITVADFPSGEDYQAQLKVILSGTGFIKEGPGTLQIGGGTGSSNTYSGLVTVNDGTLIIRKGSDGIEAITAGGLLINTGGTVIMPKKRQINDAATVTVAGGALRMVSSGGDTFASLVLKDGLVVNDDTGNNRELEATSSILVESGTIDGNINKTIRLKGSGGLTKTTDGTVVLGSGFQGQYYGLTSIDGGTLILNGVIEDSYRVDVNSGGTLGGSGEVENSVKVNSGGTLSPGESIGTLTVGELTLKAGSTTIMEVNASSATSDLVTWSDDATYAGDLQVNNLSGTLTSGQNFQIFSAGGSGSFDSITPEPGDGLAWSFDAASGVLSVVSGVNTTPPDLAFGVSNGTVNISWPGDRTGWQLQYQTNNLSTNWLVWPDSTLTNDMTIPMDPTDAAAFYRLIYPPE
ncbi:chondroitinase-B domain-containing protein [Pontiellaceae bacterium B12219]|nr:chondroitinase-B domain-containing protein [Pontiellaceae bacterium B12219]